MAETMEQKNYYDILGVPETATEAEIKKAFRTLAKQCHPDHHPGDAKAEARFKEISEAWEVLGDADKRHKYDELRRYSAGGGPRGGMSYDEFFSRFGGARTQGDNEFTWGFGGSSLEDIFSNLFGGRTTQQTRPRGGGRTGGASARRSPFSQGSSQRTPASADPQPTTDPFFKRKGDDAYVDVRVNLAQAMLGSKIRVRTPSGQSVHVRIPAGLSPGAVLRVRGMGYGNPDARGDLYIRTQLIIPSALTPGQREAVERFARDLDLKH